MQVADHCRPDGWRYRYLPHIPVCAWPEDSYVQWGESSYQGVAFFFEVLTPLYITGHGSSVADAEATAFKIFQRQSSCTAHEFERRGYQNGGGFCKYCGMFNGEAFAPTEEWLRQEAKYQAQRATEEAETGKLEEITPESLKSDLTEILTALIADRKEPAA